MDLLETLTARRDCLLEAKKRVKRLVKIRFFAYRIFCRSSDVTDGLGAPANDKKILSDVSSWKSREKGMARVESQLRFRLFPVNLSSRLGATSTLWVKLQDLPG